MDDSPARVWGGGRTLRDAEEAQMEAFLSEFVRIVEDGEMFAPSIDHLTERVRKFLREKSQGEDANAERFY